jgi:Flp pilus assembly protein TadD
MSVVDDLATVATAQGRYPEAIALRKQALTLSPGEPKLHLNLGMTYLWAWMDGDADRELAEAVRLSPDLNKFISEKRAVVLHSRKPGRGKGLKEP